MVASLPWLTVAAAPPQLARGQMQASLAGPQSTGPRFAFRPWASARPDAPKPRKDLRRTIFLQCRFIHLNAETPGATASPQGRARLAVRLLPPPVRESLACHSASEPTRGVAVGGAPGPASPGRFGAGHDRRNFRLQLRQGGRGE